MGGWIGGCIPACVTGIGVEEWEEWSERRILFRLIWLNEGVTSMLIVVTFL